jgi:hypothetical protein
MLVKSGNWEKYRASLRNSWGKIGDIAKVAIATLTGGIATLTGGIAPWGKIQRSYHHYTRGLI